MRGTCPHPVAIPHRLADLFRLEHTPYIIHSSIYSVTNKNINLHTVITSLQKCIVSYFVTISLHLWQQCPNSKFVIFQEKILNILKCYNFLWVHRRHNCSPAASFANCVMTLYLLKVHLQTLLFIPITQKCQILSSDTLVANARCQNDSKCVRLRIISVSIG